MRQTKIISAVNENFGIGKDGEIPWRVPGDFQFFKAMTYDSTVIVGRKTFENIGMLPGRRFFVLTNDESKTGTGSETDEHGVSKSVTYINSYESLYVKLMNRNNVWIAGGASVYEHYTGISQDIYLSHIPGTHDCDTFFPKDKLEEYYEPVAKVPAEGFSITRYTKTEPKNLP